MATTADDLKSGIETSLRDLMSLWFDMSNEVVNQSRKIGQPVLEAYLDSLSGTVRNYDNAYRKPCDIPETACPPHCSCRIDWDACQGTTVTATLDIHNTAKTPSQFVLTADSFSDQQENTEVSLAIKPSNFSLDAGQQQKIDLTVNIPETMEANQIYRSEIKIAGRYEQFVCLSLLVRKKSRPNCRVDHGEIPTRIVAKNWYDHFQCEELCFEPVVHRNDDTPTNDVPGVRPVPGAKPVPSDKPVPAQRKVAQKKPIKSSPKTS